MDPHCGVCDMCVRLGWCIYAHMQLSWMPEPHAACHHFRSVNLSWNRLHVDMQRLEEDNKRLQQNKLPIASNLANKLRRNDYLWALDISNCRLQVHASTHTKTHADTSTNADIRKCKCNVYLAASMRTNFAVSFHSQPVHRSSTA